MSSRWERRVTTNRAIDSDPTAVPLCWPDRLAMPASTGKHTTAATTLPMSRRAHLAQTGYLLAPEQVIASPETRVRYRIDRLLGEGGFGQVYLAGRVGRSRTVPSVVCIKVSARIDGWLREAYFGQLLDG